MCRGLCELMGNAFPDVTMTNRIGMRFLMFFVLSRHNPGLLNYISLPNHGKEARTANLRTDSLVIR